MAITLPTNKIPAETQDPRNLIIFSKPKYGKSTACANLPGALCIDLEGGGYDYIDAVKVKASSVKDLKEICAAIKEAKYPYKFIVLDTITRLEEMVKPLALKLYLNSPAGQKFTGDDVLDAPMGAGYSALRKALEMVIDMVSKCAPNIILICHTKDSAIGYLDRDEDSNTILSFNTNDKFVECGARPEHLRNADVVLGEMKEDGNIEFHWERIYPSLLNPVEVNI